MDIEATYKKIVAEIGQGHRGLLRFNQVELEFLVRSLEEPEPAELEKLLCLINHSAVPHLPFEKGLINCLNSELPAQLTVFTLNCTRKHIIMARGQKGERLTYDYLEALKKQLYSRSPEVVEWTLRAIEESGNQGVYFLREFDKIRPAPWKWFNEHQRAVREIITMLERRWGRFENPEKR